MKLPYIIDVPNLLKQWDWEKNATLGLFPEKITCGSNKSAWWICDVCGYNWRSNCNNRTKGNGCPACANKVLIKGKNDLLSQHPEIAKKWHSSLNEKGADEVFSHSCQKAWWVCDKDVRHVFSAKVSHLTEGRIICPICSNQKIVVGINDLSTTHPNLLKEWDYEKNKITPQEVTFGTNKKVWWKCSKMHGWRATIVSRAGKQQTDCPECKKELRQSLPEKTIAFYLSKKYAVEETKHFVWLRKKEIDIYIPALRLGIEYDGRQWHKEPQKDLLKDELCKKNGISLLRIREEGCPFYSTTAFVVVVPIFRDKVAQLAALVKKVFSFLNDHFSTALDTTPDINKDYFEIVKKVASMEKDNSVANNALFFEWNYKRNKGLDPRFLSLGAHEKVWWLCKQGHEWKAAIYSRASGIGCPYCSGKKVLEGYNDLQTLFPELAKQWDHSRNEIKPTQVRPQSNKVFWWVCHRCGNEWEAAVSHRVRGRNCPKCGRTKTTEAHFKKVINMETGEVFSSIKEAAQSLRINACSISDCCRGKRKKAGGFRWRFFEQ